MSIRVLTINEMLALPEGTEAVLVKEAPDTEAGTLEVGTVLHKKEAVGNDERSVAFYHSHMGLWDFFDEGEVGVVEITKHPMIIKPDVGNLGVFRPELETRKVGKIRVELVDDGFPLALREVAQVMTWAQTAKGYKDHDWQNLPNAEIALAAAASRHRTDHIKQRIVNGLPITECVDTESSLLHKAHEAFGVLAQLELMLRGKFVDSRPQVGV